MPQALTQQSAVGRTEASSSRCSSSAISSLLALRLSTSLLITHHLLSGPRRSADSEVAYAVFLIVDDRPRGVIDVGLRHHRAEARRETVAVVGHHLTAVLTLREHCATSTAIEVVST